MTRGRRRQRPFTHRLLDLPWEDVLLPHVLSRVPLRQLLWLQRVSRAFRALVQLHLARLRRFDAAQVSLGLEPRPLLDTARPPLPARAPPPPPSLQPGTSSPQTPAPLSTLPDSPWASRNAWEAIHPAKSTLNGGVPGINLRARRVSPGRAGAKPRGQPAARKELLRGE